MPSIFSLLPSAGEKGVVFSVKAGKNALTGVLSNLETFRVDATLSQKHSSTTNITTNPVEEGLEPSDHIDRRPLEIIIDGIITDTPIRLIDSAVTSVAGLAGRALTQSSALNPRLASAATAGISAAASIAAGALMNSNTRNRVKTSMQIFQAMQDQAALVDITTRLKVYENMALRNFSVNLNKTNGSSLPFTAEFVEIRVVSTKVIKVPKLLIDPSIDSSAGPLGPLGTQNATDASAAETGRLESTLSRNRALPSQLLGL
jgi:hypothetical protein